MSFAGVVAGWEVGLLMGGCEGVGRIWEGWRWLGWKRLRRALGWKCKE